MKSLREQYEESQQNAFMREVGEAVRADRVRNLWNRWKYWIALAAVALLACAAGYNISTARKRGAAMGQAAKFEAIIGDGRVKISELADFAAAAKYGYRDIAYENLYSARMDGKDAARAIEALKAAYETASNTAHGNVALVKLLSMPSFDRDPEYAGYFRRLLGIGRSDPMYATSRAVAAAAYAARGEFARARAMLDDIDGADGAPMGIKSIAADIRNYIAASEIK
ncbi:MAG: hypothetical protein LBT92_04270 [Rickettsiales bacterium]|jgi:hypothetical protein|nr:hypothetical protein [Rickettsiales bacterium]